MEATFKGNAKTVAVMVTIFTEQTRSRNMEATVKGNP